jgi:hypothetical protein
MKKYLSLALAAVSVFAFAGCQNGVGVDNPYNQNNAVWNNFITGTLVTRYPGKTQAELFTAASRGIDAYLDKNGGGARVGQITPKTKSTKSVPYYEIVARAAGDIKVSIVISTAKEQRAKEEWTQVSVQYGTWGNMKESQKIVSFITQNL